MLNLVDKSTHEENLFRTLKTKNRQFKFAVTFLTGNNDIFIVTSEINYFTVISVIECAQHTVTRIPAGAYEFEILNKDIKRKIIVGCRITEKDHRLTIKPSFSTLGSSTAIDLGRGWQFSFAQDDILGKLLSFKQTLKYDECILWKTLVDILSIYSVFLQKDMARGVIFKGIRTAKIQIFRMDIGPRYKQIEKFRGRFQ